MEVVHLSDMRKAYRFSEKLKDRLYAAVSNCWRAHPQAIWDKDDKPAMRVKLYDNSASLILDKEVHIGDYIVFNEKEDKVLDILTPEQFLYSYIIINE